MKNSKMIVHKRQQVIIQKLHEEQRVDTEQLAADLNVSQLTIRRDLHDLAERHIVRLIRGGANLITGSLHDDPSLDPPTTDAASHKEAIARLAANFINDGDTIFINSSSTAVQMIRFITGRRVIIVTNNGQALAEPRDPQVELIITGGEVHANKKSMVGEIAIANLSRINADKAFIGVSGISARDGFSTSVLQETSINEMMIRRSRHCFILAEGSKIGRQNNFFIGSATLARKLITDPSADPDQLYQLREAGVEVELAI